MVDIPCVPLYNQTVDMIIDASCIVVVLTKEPERELVLEKTEGARLLSPACLPYEVGNALSAMVRRGRIGAELAVDAMEEYRTFPVRLVEPDVTRAVRIAAEEKHYAYDAYYIACALDMGLPLFSFDGGLVEVARKRGVTCL